MATVPVTCPAIGTFTYNPDQPTYWVEFYSHTMLKNLEAMQAAGFVFDDGQIAAASLSSLWTAQTTAINEQTDHINWLKERLGEDAAGSTGIVGILKDFSKWILQETVKNALAEYIEHQSVLLDMLGELGDDIADVIADGTIDGAVWIIDFFEKKAAPGVKQCDTMIAENNALKNLSISYTNYDLRRETLEAHQTIIRDLESHLVSSDGAIFDVIRLVVDIIKAFYGGDSRDDLPDEWDDVIASFESSSDNLDEWMESVYTADAQNLPMPTGPTFPDLSDKTKEDRRRALMVVIAKFGLKLITELIRKQKESDTESGEQIQNLITLLQERLPDPATDGKLVEVKEALEKALLDGDNPLLADLQFNDAEFQIPNTDVRVNTHGKYIKYGTK